MPANSPNGWPYILPTDNVADYPVTSQALATKADVAVPFAYALYTFNMSVGSAASYDRPVVYPVGLFTQPPLVILSKSGGTATQKWSVGAISLTSAGCTVRALTNDSGTGGSPATLTVYMLVMQYSSASAITPGVTALAQEIDWAAEEDPDALRALLDEIVQAERELAESLT